MDMEGQVYQECEIRKYFRISVNRLCINHAKVLLSKHFVLANTLRWP